MFNFDTSQKCTIKMGVESEAKETVQLLAKKVFPFQDLCHDIITSSPNDKIAGQFGATFSLKYFPVVMYWNYIWLQNIIPP